jgi:hypothetical protein
MQLRNLSSSIAYLTLVTAVIACAADRAKSATTTTVEAAPPQVKPQQSRKAAPKAVARTKGSRPPISRSGLVERADPGLDYELKSSFDGTYGWTTFKTNQWGMRDKEYSLVRAADTYRIALLGATYAMAGGVEVDSSFHWLLEDYLNKTQAGGRYRKFEILNFGVAGYSLLQTSLMLDRRVFSFKPNMILLVLDPRDFGQLGDQLIALAQDGDSLPYQELNKRWKPLGTMRGMPVPAIATKVRPLIRPFSRYLLGHIAETAEAHGTRAMAVVLPMAGASIPPLDVLERETLLATEAGFKVISLPDIFEDQKPESLLVPRGRSPNTMAHRIVAENLERELTAFLKSDNSKKSASKTTSSAPSNH